MTTPSLHAPAVVSDTDVDALRRRVRGTRRVCDPWRGDASRGFGPAELQPLLERWADGYDWRGHERRVRALPWQLVGTGPDALRVVHQPATDADAPVVVLLHGWPDSVLRFERLLPRLTDLNVVVPALPGFPFAHPHPEPASIERIAELVAGAAAELGYDRFVVSGGDVGGDVAELLAGAHPERVAALHLTNISPRHAQTVDPDRLSPEGRAYLAVAGAWFRAEGGYILEQSTRPRTLLAALGDSPVGLAAWIVEKLSAWSDDAAASFSLDELLTWVSAYWFSGAIGTSLASYAEPGRVPDRTEVPTVVSAFPADTKPAPRAYVEAFVDLREFVVHDAGGHFAAWEQPHAYEEDLRRALALS